MRLRYRGQGAQNGGYPYRSRKRTSVVSRGSPDQVIAEADAGVVTLRGVVDQAYQKSYAEAVARRVPGVVDIRNNITIGFSVEFSRPTLHPSSPTSLRR